MPLSKARDRARKKQARLEKRVVRPIVQPKQLYRVKGPGWVKSDGAVTVFPEYLDADGNPVYDAWC